MADVYVDETQGGYQAVVNLFLPNVRIVYTTNGTTPATVTRMLLCDGKFGQMGMTWLNPETLLPEVDVIAWLDSIGVQYRKVAGIS